MLKASLKREAFLFLYSENESKPACFSYLK